LSGLGDLCGGVCRLGENRPEHQVAQKLLLVLTGLFFIVEGSVDDATPSNSERNQQRGCIYRCTIRTLLLIIVRVIVVLELVISQHAREQDLAIEPALDPRRPPAAQRDLEMGLPEIFLQAGVQYTGIYSS
jgi:hypothetical protein